MHQLRSLLHRVTGEQAHTETHPRNFLLKQKVNATKTQRSYWEPQSWCLLVGTGSCSPTTGHTTRSHAAMYDRSTSSELPSGKIPCSCCCCCCSWHVAPQGTTKSMSGTSSPASPSSRPAGPTPSPESGGVLEPVPLPASRPMSFVLKTCASSSCSTALVWHGCSISQPGCCSSGCTCSVRDAGLKQLSCG